MSRIAVVLGALLAAAVAAPAWGAEEPKEEPQAQQQVDEQEDEKPAPALKATFLGEGTWATEEDCRKLRTIEAGGEYPEDGPPRLLTIDGSNYSDQRCTFASLDAQPGGAFRAGMHCRGGCDSFTETLIFTPAAKGGGYAMSYATDPRQQPLIRCEPKPKPVETN